MDIDRSLFSEVYCDHIVFEELKHILEFYDMISETCLTFLPIGTRAILNYASDVYSAIYGTLDSIQTLLRIGRINDAYSLTRKYFDDALLDIYIDVIRKDKYDWRTNAIVQDIDEWLRNEYRIPKLEILLATLEKSESTKEIYPFFGWETYFRNSRKLLNDSVHGNRYNTVILNCNRRFIPNREKHLQNIHVIIKHVFTMHLSFIFHLNSHYLMASDYTDYLDFGITPPKGSEFWIAPYAQDTFDRYIKDDIKLATFIKQHSCLNIK